MAGGDFYLNLGDSWIFTSPNYPSDYQNSLSVSWTVHSQLGNGFMITFIDFDVEQSYDFLFIESLNATNGTVRIASLTGSFLPRNIHVNVSPIQIRFASNYVTPRKRFSLRVTSIPGCYITFPL